MKSMCITLCSQKYLSSLPIYLKERWIRTLKLNWAFAGAFATICIVSIFTFAIIRDDFSTDSFTKTDIQDERILEDLDMAISQDTSDVLAIYGPWENTNIDNSGGMN